MREIGASADVSENERYCGLESGPQAKTSRVTVLLDDHLCLGPKEKWKGFTSGVGQAPGSFGDDTISMSQRTPLAR